MQRTTISALFLVLLACIVSTGAVMPGVLQFSQGNATVQGPIYQTGLTSSGAILWAAAPGGLVYQINATSMQYISSTTLSPPLPACSGTVFLGIPTCLFTDDVHGRIYVCYSPTVGTCMSLYILNTTMGVISSGSYLPYSSAGTVYNLPLSLHYYDQSSRMLASLSWVTGSTEQGIQLYNVSSDNVHSGAIQVDAFTGNNPIAIDGLYYSFDTLYYFYHGITGPPYHFNNDVGYISGISTLSGSPPSASVTAEPLEPFAANPVVGTSGQFVSGPMTFTSSYTYALFDSTVMPSQGSYLLQFSDPLVSANPYTPKSAVSFPTQASLLAVALDETATSSTSGVIFVSTYNGQLLKYRYSDPGPGSAITVTTPNYNSDTQVSSANPSFSYQTYSKTTQAIYLSSSSTSGGIWRVPFYDCGAAASCSSCAALNDPYCGWCPLSGTCTTNASCSTGKIFAHKQSTLHLSPTHKRRGRFF
jgi:hypothetical protein